MTLPKSQIPLELSFLGSHTIGLLISWCSEGPVLCEETPALLLNGPQRLSWNKMKGLLLPGFTDNSHGAPVRPSVWSVRHPKLSDCTGHQRRRIWLTGLGALRDRPRPRGPGGGADPRSLFCSIWAESGGKG